MDKTIPKSLYLESCVLVHFLENDIHADAVERAIRLANENVLTLWTSVLAIAEVNFAASEREKKKFSEETEEKIASLWSPMSPIRLIEPSQLLCVEAHKLLREGSILRRWSGTKGVDAIHLASAHKHCDMMFCACKDMKRWEKYISPVSIRVPYLIPDRSENPAETAPLYEQSEE